MTAKLVLVLDVSDREASVDPIDPRLVDPHDLAGYLIDDPIYVDVEGFSGWLFPKLDAGEWADDSAAEQAVDEACQAMALARDAERST